MSRAEFDTDIGTYNLDFEDFDTDLFGDNGVGVDLEVVQTAIGISPNATYEKPPIQQNFNTSSGVTAGMTAQLTSGLAEWKPTAVSTQKVDKGINQKQDNANAQVADAKTAIGQMREQAKDMTREATADSNGPANDTSLGRKLTSNAITDVGVVGAAAMIDPSGVLPSMAATASVAKDIATIGSAALTSVSGQGTVATNGKGNDLARSSREISARSGGREMDTGYQSTESSPVDEAPVTNAVFAKLSQGPGFGKGPTSITGADIDYADATLPYIAMNVEESPEMVTALNTLHAGTETAAATAKVTTEGYVATVDNILDAQDMTPTSVADNPFEMKNPFEADLEAGPGRVMV